MTDDISSIGGTPDHLGVPSSNIQSVIITFIDIFHTRIRNKNTQLLFFIFMETKHEGMSVLSPANIFTFSILSRIKIYKKYYGRLLSR